MELLKAAISWTSVKLCGVTVVTCFINGNALTHVIGWAAGLVTIAFNIWNYYRLKNQDKKTKQ